MVVLGMLAGIYIGLGGLVATIALAGADTLPFGVAQLLAGSVFVLGLPLVMIARSSGARYRQALPFARWALGTWQTLPARFSWRCCLSIRLWHPA
jgi:hypothetical protein